MSTASYSVTFSSCCLLWIMLFVMSPGAPIPRSGTRHGKFENREEHANYLSQYGHLRRNHKNTLSREVSDEEFRDAVKSLQLYGGINVTGEVDEMTRKLMASPRCGVPDVPLMNSRRKRFDTVNGQKTALWPSTNITYRYFSFPSTMDMDDVRSTFKTAFQYWSSVTPLNFTETKKISETNVSILFASYDHGDGFLFDGRGGMLAHTFYPIDGRTHYDDSEQWSSHSATGTSLLEVATHEIGHLLGLNHSLDQTAVMNAYYQGYVSDWKLQPDDIGRIQDLYGSRDAPNVPNPNPAEIKDKISSSTTTSTTTTTTTTSPTTTTTLTSSTTTTSTSTTTTTPTTTSTTTAKNCRNTPVMGGTSQRPTPTLNPRTTPRQTPSYRRNR